MTKPTPDAIRTEHDDTGRAIYRLTSERKRLTRDRPDDDARGRIAEIDAELEELGVQRTAPPDGVVHGPEA